MPSLNDGRRETCPGYAREERESKKEQRWMENEDADGGRSGRAHMQTGRDCQRQRRGWLRWDTTATTRHGQVRQIKEALRLGIVGLWIVEGGLGSCEGWKAEG